MLDSGTGSAGFGGRVSWGPMHNWTDSKIRMHAF